MILDLQYFNHDFRKLHKTLIKVLPIIEFSLPTLWRFCFHYSTPIHQIIAINFALLSKTPINNSCTAQKLKKEKVWINRTSAFFEKDLFMCIFWFKYRYTSLHRLSKLMELESTCHSFNTYLLSQRKQMIVLCNQ